MRARTRVCVVAGARARACVYALVVLLFQHASPRYIAICGLSDLTTFLDIIS